MLRYLKVKAVKMEFLQWIQGATLRDKVRNMKFLKPWMSSNFAQSKDFNCDSSAMWPECLATPTGKRPSARLGGMITSPTSLASVLVWSQQIKVAVDRETFWILLGPPPAGESVVPAPPISRLAHRLLHTSNTVFLKCGSPFGFLPPPLLLHPGDGPGRCPAILARGKAAVQIK